jgi:hypothetical protein
MSRIRRIVTVALLSALIAVPALAQETYPARTITLIVPFPPGGIADLTARPLAAAMERVLRQPVVVNNKAGAAGAVGMQSAAIARPDGYTLLVALVSISTIPEVDALFARTPAYTRDQFVGIARLNADLGSERDDLGELPLAQLACHRAEDARAHRVLVGLDQHDGVPVEADVRAVLAANLLHRAHDHRARDLALLDGAVR